MNTPQNLWEFEFLQPHIWKQTAIGNIFLCIPYLKGLFSENDSFSELQEFDSFSDWNVKLHSITYIQSEGVLWLNDAPFDD